jgi:DNA helicase HerA-like ATPase
MTINNPAGNYLGLVIGGSLNQGVEVLLDAKTHIEEIAGGQPVVIQGKNLRFFGIITNITLQSSDQSIKTNPPDFSNAIISAIASQSSMYATMQVITTLTISGTISASVAPKPAKNIPSHFSKVYLASDEDINMVFGSEDQRHFWVGTPPDLESKVRLNLEEFVKRSNGVFGKSGTGKTFLTRLLLIGIVQKNTAVNLVFDMENEYGWTGTFEGPGSVKGLKNLFPSKVAVFSLDENYSRRRNITPDYLVKIGYNEIEPEDIEILRENLNLSAVAADAAYTLRDVYGRDNWIKKLIELDRETLQEISNKNNLNMMALSTLQNRIRGLTRFSFLEEKSTGKLVEQILYNIDAGKHIILEFGGFKDNLDAYILVTNLLTRRIHRMYAERADAAMGDESIMPRPLVITIEEAHKFLNPTVASQTIFGTIAREDRKRRVTLLIVDQRPSGIDDEVMSQLGTKLSCLLDNEKDVESVMSGASGSRELRSVLSKLESKQQSLIFGHSVPMPIVIKVRDFGTPESYLALLGSDGPNGFIDNSEKDREDFFGKE